MTRRAPAHALPLALLFLPLLHLACDEPVASREDCLAIIDRIVEIELQEQGLRDPVLAARKRIKMRERFGSEIDACVGRRLPQGARACVAQVEDVETLSHHCLR